MSDIDGNLACRRLAIVSIWIVASVVGGGKREDATADELPRAIVSIFAEKCIDCHVGEDAEAGLSMSTLLDVMVGGDSGPAVHPGDLERSLLWRRIASGEMPPADEPALSEAERGVIRAWIRDGRFPKVGEVEAAKSERLIEEARRHWAFRPIVKPVVPDVGADSWARTEVDRFIAAKWKSAGVVGIEDAAPERLLRRLYFDLTGLPPTPAEVREFLAKEGDMRAYDRLVDRLLAAPEFGERWGRHWLDVARYADTVGGGANYTMNNAWRYRDYVIESFNKDKPYDRFVMEQIAGDLLPFESRRQREEQLIATGFLAIGPKDLTDVDKVKVVADVIDEQLDTLGKAFMGLAIGCARCHGHKFDPIPMRDYYALAGIFASTKSLKEQDDSKRFSSWPDWLRIPLPTMSDAERRTLIGQAREHEEELKRRKTELMQQIARLKRSTSEEQREGGELAATQRLLADVVAQAERLRAVRIYYGDPIPVLIGVQEAASPVDCRINIRGNPRQLGEPVRRGVIRAMGLPCPSIEADESGRLQLARWLVDPRHPLTARVMVNRIWQHLFGRGLVATPDNFGTRGSPPTHPELLDYLAAVFIADGYSVKKMVRRLTTSRVYQLACASSESARRIDPDNDLLWRRRGRRLEAEEVRDALLAIGGELDRQRGGPTLEHIGRFGLGNLFEIERENLGNRRAVYLPVYRGMLFDRGAMFFTFDFCDPNLTAGRRPESIVPTQALFLMNDELALRSARALAERLLHREVGDAERVRESYAAVLGRLPSESELASALEFLGRDATETAGTVGASLSLAAWSAWCQVLFCSSEFLIVE